MSFKVASLEAVAIEVAAAWREDLERMVPHCDIFEFCRAEELYRLAVQELFNHVRGKWEMKVPG